MLAEIVNMKQDYFWEELEVEFKERTLSSVMAWIKNYLKNKDIQENAICNISYENRFSEEGHRKESIVHIKYFTIDLSKVRAMPKEDQIRFVLKKMGYEESDIKKIEYRKYYAHSDELILVVTIKDKSFDYGPDESLSERNHMRSIYKCMESVLDFNFIPVITPY